jgi:hypothetical protein
MTPLLPGRMTWLQPHYRGNLYACNRRPGCFAHVATLRARARSLMDSPAPREITRLAC